MNTAGIMAIPETLDTIRLVGPEEKHVTLLFFGSTDSLPENAKETMLSAVETAANMLFPFSESTLERTRLGDDNPPALVTMLSDRNLTQIRNLFLMNPDLKGYLSNTPQFPSFKPHVTLGFPDFKEEVTLKALSSLVYRVRFDRLAVWWGDERHEFKLNLAEQDSVGMSAEKGAEFLSHYGKKGMKWGVRKDRGHEGERARTKKIAKLDANFERNATNVHTWVRVHNFAADKANKFDIDRINNKPEYKGKDFSKPSALRTKYYKEHHDAYLKRVEEGAADIGLNASGTRKLKVFVDEDSNWSVFADDVEHAAADAPKPLWRVKVNYTADGHIQSLGGDTMAHMEVSDLFLAHFGVKGMKWGRRRSRAELEAARSAESKQLSETISKAKATKVDSLSNQEIQQAITRMSLERQFKQNVELSSPGRRFLTSLLKDDAVQEVSIDSFVGKVGEKRGYSSEKTARVQTNAKNLAGAATKAHSTATGQGGGGNKKRKK